MAFLLRFAVRQEGSIWEILDKSLFIAGILATITNVAVGYYMDRPPPGVSLGELLVPFAFLSAGPVLYGAALSLFAQLIAKNKNK